MIEYHRVHEIVAGFSEPNRLACEDFLKENEKRLRFAYGSVHNHQSWMGGYLDHIAEVMNIAAVLYPSMNACRPLPFTLEDAQLVLFLHDIEKPWKYETGKDGQLQHRSEFASKADDHGSRHKLIDQYRFFLKVEQWDALKYVEGEMADYSARKRVMNPLAAFCHICDVASARIWFDFPKMGNDEPWDGADRLIPVEGRGYEP